MSARSLWEYLAGWTGMGALIALACLQAGCNSGGKADPTAEQVVYRPEWLLDTTYTWGQLMQKDRCADSLSADRMEELRRICADVLPVDGRIWTRNKAGNSCRCECPDWSKYTVWQVDSMKAAKQLIEAKRVVERLSIWDSMAAQWAHSDSLYITKKKKKKKSYPRVDYVPFDDARDCMHVDGPKLIECCLPIFWTDKEAMALWAFGQYAEPANYPVFLYSITNVDNEYPSSNGSPSTLGTWAPGDGERYDSGFRIYFPRNFVHAPQVGWELMLFFVGHELGHALGEEAPCSSRGGIICEGQCDHWGASVGLRRVCGSGLNCKTYSAIAEAAAVQLEAYMDVVHADPSCGGPMCPICPDNTSACGYPPKACRAETIRAAIVLLPEPECTRDWYTRPGRSTACSGPRLPGDAPCP